jgi:hypothetical protein
MIIHHGSPKGLLLQLQVEPTWGSWELGGENPRFITEIRYVVLTMRATSTFQYHIMQSKVFTSWLLQATCADAEAAASRGEL